jgi:hypothetical protein
MKKSTFRKTLLLIILLVSFLSVNSLVFPQETKPFLGTWKGSLNVMGQELEIIVKLSLGEKKEIQGTIDVPQQGAVDLNLASFNIEGKKISFMIDHPGVQGEPTFKGELDESGGKITGSFTQGGGEGTFNLEKEKK